MKHWEDFEAQTDGKAWRTDGQTVQHRPSIHWALVQKRARVSERSGRPDGISPSPQRLPSRVFVPLNDQPLEPATPLPSCLGFQGLVDLAQMLSEAFSIVGSGLETNLALPSDFQWLLFFRSVLQLSIRGQLNQVSL